MIAEESKTMPTFTKLLAIRTVAKSFLDADSLSGSSNNSITRAELSSFACLSSSNLDGPKEKKATSDAENKALKMSNTRIIRAGKMKPG